MKPEVRTLLAGVTALIVGVGLTSLAVGQDDGEQAPASAGPEFSVGPMGPAETRQRQDMAEQMSEWEADADHEQVTHIPEHPVPDALLSRCEDLIGQGADADGCRLAVMHDRGDLQPGDYSDAEIRVILSAR